VIVKPRAGQKADLLANALRREIAKADPNLPLYFVDTPKKHLDARSRESPIATMFSIFDWSPSCWHRSDLRCDVVRRQPAQQEFGSAWRSAPTTAASSPWCCGREFRCAGLALRPAADARLVLPPATDPETLSREHARSPDLRRGHHACHVVSLIATFVPARRARASTR